MGQETYKPLEYRDEAFQNLRSGIIEYYFTPMDYEPTTADWATIKILRNIH